MCCNFVTSLSFRTAFIRPRRRRLPILLCSSSSKPSASTSSLFIVWTLIRHSSPSLTLQPLRSIHLPLYTDPENAIFKSTPTVSPASSYPIPSTTSSRSSARSSNSSHRTTSLLRRGGFQQCCGVARVVWLDFLLFCCRRSLVLSRRMFVECSFSQFGRWCLADE